MFSFDNSYTAFIQSENLPFPDSFWQDPAIRAAVRTLTRACYEFEKDPDLHPPSNRFMGEDLKNTRAIPHEDALFELSIAINNKLPHLSEGELVGYVYDIAAEVQAHILPALKREAHNASYMKSTGLPYSDFNNTVENQEPFKSKITLTTAHRIVCRACKEVPPLHLHEAHVVTATKNMIVAYDAVQHNGPRALAQYNAAWRRLADELCLQIKPDEHSPESAEHNAAAYANAIASSIEENYDRFFAKKQKTEAQTEESFVKQVKGKKQNAPKSDIFEQLGFTRSNAAGKPGTYRMDLNKGDNGPTR